LNKFSLKHFLPGEFKIEDRESDTKKQRFLFMCSEPKPTKKIFLPSSCFYFQ